MKSFWTVWSPQSPKNNPTVKHNNFGDAETEARRLAVAIPGQEFIVMKSEVKYQADSVTRTVYQ